MGEMPKLGPDPWSLAQAFLHSGGYNHGLTPYQQERLALQKQKLAQQGYDTSSSDLSAQDTADDREADMADGTIPQTPTNGPTAPSQFRPLISQAAMDAGVNVPLFTRLVKAESSFNPNAVSPTGARGLTQLMPGTAKQMGVADASDPAQNLAGGAKYLAMQEHKYGDDARALAAYNWGPGNVDKWIRNGANPAAAPKETRDYVQKIAGRPLAMNDTPQEQPQSDDTDKVDPTTRLSWLA